MEENVLTPGDYFAILKRRKWALIIPFILIVIASVLTALLLPSIYKSTATILIEQREIPTEYVNASMTTYADQRMQSIKQRVLTSKQLQDLIHQFNLYPKLQKKMTIDEIVDEMRDKILLEPVNVDVSDKHSGRMATVTIAFTLSYEGENPEKVQLVTSTITTLFLKEDLKVRTAQASDTYNFLKGEKERIRKKLAEYEKTLAVFKKKYSNSLPGVLQLNMQALDHIERNIEVAKENLRASKEKEEGLKEQLLNIPVSLESALKQQGKKDDDQLRLENLKMNLINLKTKFSDLYPDVKKLKQEIKDLTAKIDKKKKDNTKKPADDPDSVKNPAYVTLASRLASIRSDIKSTKNKIKDMEKQAEVYRSRLAVTPDVEEKYNAIISERNILNGKYQEMQSKMMEARVSQELESKQQGERFTLVESATLPDKPFKPNRLAIILIGIVLGMGAGVGFASIREFSDTSFRDAESLHRATGFPVLTVVPRIITSQDRTRRFMKRIIVSVAVVAAVVVLIILFNNYVMDLNVVWAKIMRQF